MSNAVARPDSVTDERLEYLDELRESSVVNMYGAGEYVENKFDVDRKEAKEVVTYWMETFGNEER
jgi:hypothetical protein